MILSLLILLPIVFIAVCLYSFVVPPRDFPRNIPVIPFYVTFISLFKKIDQEHIYHTYLQEPLNKHGAVIIYFGSRWNVLLQRPEYLSEVFKDINVFEKSGNQKKVPHSVLAAYTGDNIISAHGETWKSYRKIMQPGLQKNFDPVSMKTNSILFVNLIKEQTAISSNKSIPVQQLIQRFTLANVSEELLGTDFEVSTIHINLHLTNLNRLLKDLMLPCIFNSLRSKERFSSLFL